MDWLSAHAKFIPPLIAAILVFVVDDDTAAGIAAAVGALLTYLIPNDPGAIERVYGRNRYER
jgi:hypothetical protein